MRTRHGLAVIVVFLAGSAGSAQADDPVLTGEVGTNDSFAISLVDASGAHVKHVDSGTYTLVVHDRSVHHNFHLTGPGVNVTTDTVGTFDQPVSRLWDVPSGQSLAHVAGTFVSASRDGSRGG